ncbi:MAG: hypothetical protein ACOYEG_02325 [Petrimonas sp.]|jgi:hypothetical protein|nr:MAG: hypothetical protein BWZ00_00654 [Bacteroidetes bacterium ADurb.BinA174]
MKRKLFHFFVLIICLFACKHKTQTSDIETTRIKNMIAEIRFIDYDDVFNDMENSTNALSEEEYSYMLFLDTTYIQLIEKKYPKLVDEFKYGYDFLDYSEIENNSRKRMMKFIETDIKSLKDCFRDEEVLTKILSNNSGQLPLERIRLGDEVYTKGDKIALFWLYGIGDEFNKAWKAENGLYIEHISTVMSH